MQIDMERYREGRADFENGLTLRDVVQLFINEHGDPVLEEKLFSHALGFADALIDTIRGNADIPSGKGKR